MQCDLAPLQQPVILRQQFADWPLVKAARESEQALAGYICAFAPRQAVKAFAGGKEIEGRYFYSEDFRGLNFDRIELTLTQLFERLHDIAARGSGESVYAGAIPLKAELEALLAANCNPLLDPSIEQLSSLWIGNQGVTATHYDLPQNVAGVVCGRRRFTLFPPEQLDNLYLGPLDITLAGQPVSMVDLEDPDLTRFPKFAAALDTAVTGVLDPGDGIYIPSMWFHHVRSLDDLGVLMNFWWRDAAPHMFTPMFTMLHAMLSVKGLPEYEKQCWKRMFEQYVFEENGDPMTHLPEHARGFFGDLDAEKVARLRLYLLHSLGGQPRQS
ncbi:MAG: cupin-like domain-containing protein [Pseudomonadota bacterium]